MTSCIGVLMLNITFSKYDCIIVHKAYYLFTCTCVSINSFHSHSHSHIKLTLINNVVYDYGFILNSAVTLCIYFSYSVTILEFLIINNLQCQKDLTPVVLV